MSKKEHHPPHLYLDETWYIFTASTYRQLPILRPSAYKKFLRDRIKELVKNLHFELQAWVILDNHYHLLLKSRLGEDLVRFFRLLHGRTSFEFNGMDNTKGRQVWHNYWDTCIRSEKDFWTRFNYIHHNPVKHGYVTHLEDWPFSSYHYYLRWKGEDWLNEVWMKYPVVDFSDPEDNFSLPG